MPEILRLQLPLAPAHGARLLALALLRLAEFNPDEARDERGRWISEGGFLSTPADAFESISHKEKVAVSPEDLRGVLQRAAMKNVGPVDLTHLTIEGTPLFAGGLNRNRLSMPQIPKEHQADFLESLKAQGIDVKRESVSPTSLLPTQNEIDAGRVGQKLLDYDKGKTIRPVMVSKDSYVLDGHHRWAVEVALDVESPQAGIKMPVIRIMQDHDKALRTMLAYTKKTGIKNKALEFNPDQPRDEHGQWSAGGSSSVKTPEGSSTWYKGMYPYDWTKEVRNDKELIDPGPVIAPEDINRTTDFPTLDNEDREGFKIRGFFTHDPDVAGNFAASVHGKAAMYKVEIGAHPDRVHTIDAKGQKAYLTQFGPTGRPFRDVARSGKYDVIIIKNTADEGHLAVVLGGSKIRNKIGVRAAQIRFAEFNPDQPRDESGKWTSGGNAPGTTKSDWSDDAGKLKYRLQKVERRAEDIARKMGVDPSIIKVVDKEPTPFVVGNKQFKEAGHYDPRTGEIEINARNSYDDRMSVTNGIVAHEVFHAQYDAVVKAQVAEHEIISDWASNKHEEFDQYFNRSGYPRPEKWDELVEKFPASAAFVGTWGDGYLGDKIGGGTPEGPYDPNKPSNMQKMIDENGHSAYARSYWQPEAVARYFIGGTTGREIARNETLAEVTRWLVSPLSWSETGEPSPKSPWVQLSLAIRKAYPKVKK